MTTVFRPGENLEDSPRELTRVAELLSDRAGEDYEQHVEYLYTEDNLEDNFSSADVWAKLNHEVNEELIVDLLEDRFSQPWYSSFEGEEVIEFYESLGYDIENGEPVRAFSENSVRDVEIVQINDKFFVEGEFTFILSTEDGNQVHRYIGEEEPKIYEEETTAEGNKIRRDTGKGGKHIKREKFTSIDWSDSEFYIGPQERFKWGKGSKGRAKALSRYLNRLGDQTF